MSRATQRTCREILRFPYGAIVERWVIGETGVQHLASVRGTL